MRLLHDEIRVVNVMNTCKEYEVLHDKYKTAIRELINKMCGKSHITDITIEKSDLSSYAFKITVAKYNSKKGWATIGYLRHDVFKCDNWRLTYRPRVKKNEKREAGRTASYS